jgi:hypothetical protein
MEAKFTQATALAKAVAVVFAIISAVTASYVIYQYSTLDRAMSKMPLTDDVRKLASTLFFDSMTALAQLSVMDRRTPLALLETHGRLITEATCFSSLLKVAGAHTIRVRVRSKSRDARTDIREELDVLMPTVQNPIAPSNSSRV